MARNPEIVTIDPDLGSRAETKRAAQLAHFSVIGEAGYVKDGSPTSVLRGRLEHIYRSVLILTFGGGVNEVQRDIIAVAALGMPRGKNHDGAGMAGEDVLKRLQQQRFFVLNGAAADQDGAGVRFLKSIPQAGNDRR